MRTNRADCITVQLWKEGEYWVISMDEPDVTTQGKSIPDALRMLAEAYEAVRY